MAAKKILAATAALILFVAMLTPNTVLGAYAIGFQSGGTWVNDITGKVVGDTVDVSVYLRATDGELAVGGPSGLFTMGTRGTFDPVPGDVTNNVVNNVEFEIASQTVDNSIGMLTYLGRVDVAARDPVVGNKGDAIWLGSFSYRIDTPGTNVFRFGDFDPSKPTLDEFSVLDEDAGDIFGLDNILFGANLDVTYNLSITAVPEPSSLMLGLSALAIGAAVAWRRRSAR